MEQGLNKIKQLKRALKKDPDSYNANLQMGMYHIYKEDIPAALPYLEKASSAMPDNAKLSFVIANACRGIGIPDKAQEYFIRALDTSPDNFEYLHAYGQLLQSSGNLDKAIESFIKASTIRSESFELLNDIGVLFFQKQDYNQSLEYLEKACTANPNYSLALVNTGYVYLARDELEEIKPVLDRLEALDAYDPEFLELKDQYINRSRQVSDQHEKVQTDLNFSEQLFSIMPLRIIKNFGEDKLPQEIGLSIVVPIHNENENIPLLYRELVGVLSNLREAYEIILVNDGSTDGSRQVLEQIAQGDRNVRVIEFRRNYGQTAALSAGFKYSRGSVVITMDADLQNDPADIPRLLEKMAEGYDLVSGWRKDRNDKQLTRVIPSKIANGLINRLISATGVQLHDYGCTLKAYKRGIIKNINLYGEMHRFIPCFAAWLGVKVTEIPVNHRPRIHGQAKYGLSRVPRVIFDLLVVRFFSDYMTRPIQFFGKIARKLSFIGLIALLFLTGLDLFTPLEISAGEMLIMLSILMVAILQIITMGLLGEIMVRSYFEIQKKDSYIVESIINEE